MDIRRLPPALAHRVFTLGGDQGHLILVESGNATLSLDEQVLPGGHITWLPWGAPVALRLEAGTRAAILSLRQRDLSQIDGGADLAARLSTPGLTTETPEVTRIRFHHLITMIADDLATPGADSAMRIRAACALVLTGFLRLFVTPTETTGPQLPLVDRFLLLAARHSRDHWGVNDYARALGVTRFQLNDAVQRRLGRPPRAWLQEQWLQQAMTLLRQPDTRIASIAFSLGFQDPAYFSRAFRQATGQSPGAWRDSHRSPDPDSFAAWP